MAVCRLMPSHSQQSAQSLPKRIRCLPVDWTVGVVAWGFSTLDDPSSRILSSDIVSSFSDTRGHTPDLV